MPFDHSIKADARGSKFNDVGRDQINITNNVNITVTSAQQISAQQIRLALPGIIDWDDDNIQTTFNPGIITDITKSQPHNGNHKFEGSKGMPFHVDEPSEPPQSPAPPMFRWIKPNIGSKHSLLHGVNLSPKSTAKVAVFDLNTIIKMDWNQHTEASWEWWMPAIPSKLKKAHDIGYSVIVISVIIISNQVKAQAALKAWEEIKVPSIAAALPDVPFHIFGAKAKDGFRKPIPGIWYEIEHIFSEDGIHIDKSASFFVGDAAGRPNDRSSSDRKWAINIGIQFSTPEEYFFKQPPEPYDLLGWKVSDVGKSPLFTPTDTPLLPLLSKPEVIIFVGYPCLGKTTFYRRYIQPFGYKHICQDILRRKEKCIRAVEEALSADMSCVVDNTNRDVKTRKCYVDVAKKLGVPARCFKFAGSTELAWHNNLYRAYNSPSFRSSGSGTIFTNEDLPLPHLSKSGQDPHPFVAISTFHQKYEEPTMSEGFTEIKTIHWIFKGDVEAKRRWSMWLEDDKKQTRRS